VERRGWRLGLLRARASVGSPAPVWAILPGFLPPIAGGFFAKARPDVMLPEARCRAAPGTKVPRESFDRDRRYPITNKFRDKG
jgi:hypothetical protein